MNEKKTLFLQVLIIICLIITFRVLQFYTVNVEKMLDFAL